MTITAAARPQSWFPRILRPRYGWAIQASLWIPLALGLLAVSLAGCSATSTASHAVDDSLVAALARQAEQWDKAIVRKDLAAIAANMAPDFRQIRSNGTVIDREVFLRDITAPELVIDPYTVEEFDLRLYGEVALLCGRTRMTGRYAGERFTSDYRYIDIYVKRDGKWKVCSVQTTSIPESKQAK